MSIFLQMNAWWYIHTATLYKLFCRWTRDDIYIPQLYINFPADEHLKIFTDRNFMLTFMQMNTWRYKHAATFINFPADEHVMIYTYCNVILSFLHTNTWWYIHTATLYQLSCRWTPEDIYRPQLYVNVHADEHVMI